MREPGETYNDSVVPGEDCKLIKSSNQIPPRSDVAGYEDRKSEDGEGVHESPPIAGASLLCCVDICRLGGRRGRTRSFEMGERGVVEGGKLAAMMIYWW
jgi:hypothetical protein